MFKKINGPGMDNFGRPGRYDHIDLKALKRLPFPSQYTELSAYFHRNPNNRRNIFALNSMGNVCIKLAEHNEAEKYFQDLLKIAPDDTRAINGLGKVKFHKKDYLGAEKIFMRFPRDIMSLFWLRKTYLSSNRINEAQRTTDQIRDLHETNTHALNEIGKLSMQDQDYAFAKFCFMRLLEIQRDDIPAMQELGEIALYEGEIDTAGTYFKLILSLNDRDVIALNGLAKVAFAKGKYDTAIEIYMTIISIKGHDEAALGHIDAINKMLGKGK